MATPSFEILTEQSKEKEINDLKNQLKKQKVENQDLKNQLAYQKEKVHEKDEALKVKEETIAELKSSLATEECLKEQLANQRDKIQEQYDVLNHPLDHLPDEVQLNIFKFLDLDDVIRCAHVSKRTRRICHDESIWKKVNLYAKTVPSEFIEQILENGCQYINLFFSKIVGGLKLSRNDYDVKYLNVSDCKADEGVIEELISSCKSLEKLSMGSLEQVRVNVMKHLNHQQLQTLDLNTFKGLDLGLTTSVLSCKTLTEISFFTNWYLSHASVQYLVENLSSDIKKVSFSGVHSLTDEHVKILVKRCKKITALEIGGCPNITEDSLTSIVEHSKQMVELDVSGRNLGLLSVQRIFLKVKLLPNLKVLNCQHEKRSSQETENLRKLMPHLEINRDQFGGDLVIASPGYPWRPWRHSASNGLWDVVVKTIKLFPERSYGSQRRK